MVGLKLSFVTIDCAKPRDLARFWEAALGWTRTYDEDHGVVLHSDDERTPDLYLQQVPEPKVGKNRLHLDLVATDFDAQLQDLLDGGASIERRDTAPDGRPFAVLADPESNVFCLASAPWTSTTEAGN